MWSSLILCTNNEPFLHQIVTSDKKWILCDSWWWPAPRLDREEAPKHFPRPNLHPKKVMVSVWWLFGGLLTVWFSTGFWILVKPLYLRSMLSKSMRTIENFNACSWHWLTERAQVFSKLHSQCFRSWTNWVTRFCLILHIHLTSCQPTICSSNFLQGKRFYNQQEAENAFQELIKSWGMDFCTTGINKVISPWQKWL